MQRTANRRPYQVGGTPGGERIPAAAGFAKWKVGRKAAPPKAGGKAAGPAAGAKKPPTSPGMAEGGGEGQVRGYGVGGALTVSVLRAIEPQRNPLIAGGDDEHNLVLLQRLQLDAYQDRDHVFDHCTREFALSRSLEQRRLARREIDLSYLPDGELDSGLFIPPGERVTDGGEDTICEKVARGCLGVTDHDKRGFELHTDPTLQALKTEVGHLRRWGEALHDYGVLPATVLPGEELSPPPQPIARGHAASCDACLPDGLTPDERKRELMKRRKDPSRDQTFLQGPATCPAGPRRAVEESPACIKPPAFPLAEVQEARQIERRGSEADVEAELQGIGRQCGRQLQNDLDMLLDDYDDFDEDELDELNQAGTGGPGRVKELIEFFARKTPASQRVKMLEIDSRALLATIKQLRSANEEANRKLQAALREKEAMAQDVEMREKIVAQREKAVKLTLRDHFRVQRALQRNVAEASSLLQEEKKTVSNVRTSAAFLRRKLETAQTVTETHEQELNALKEQIEEMKKEYDRKEAEDFTDQRAWRKDQIKLEKLHFRCECLGEDRIRLLEAVRREKANLDLRQAELSLYKKHLEDMTKERDHFFDTAEAIKKKSAEEKAALQKRAREALEKKSAALAAQEKEAKEQQQRNAELTKELDRERGASTSNMRHMKAMKEIILSQQALLKSQSANFGSFVKSLYEFQEKLAVLSKLANNLRAAYARHQDQAAVRAARRDRSRRRVSVEVPPAAEPLSKDLLDRAFSAVAAGGDGLSPDDAATAARKAGLAPSYADIETLRAATKTTVDRKTFEKFCRAVVHNEDEGGKLASVFKVWDTSNTGVLPKTQVKFILQTFGDPLTEEEADFAIRVLADDEPQVNYRLFCEKLLACGPLRA